MRSFDPTDSFDVEEAKRLGAKDWQLDILKRNPDYTSWGPGEDYMCSTAGPGKGWNASLICPTWKDFQFPLDDLNECVNFYFSIERDNEECSLCGGNGYSPEAQEIVNTFYAHMNDKGEHWNDKITQDEVQALVKAGRLRDFIQGKPKGYVPSAEEVNAAQRRGGVFSSHDAINRSILTEARLKRHKKSMYCPKCNGEGRVFVEEDTHMSVTFWVLHPRKGCSRGVRVERLLREEVPLVLEYLMGAKKRNDERFSGVVL